MGHHITAINLKGNYDEKKAESFDLFGKELGFGLTLFHIDHYYSACWQYKLGTAGMIELFNINSSIFPCELALEELMKSISDKAEPQYAIIQTDYFGGLGEQYANVFKYKTNDNPRARTINEALYHLGVRTKSELDEFDMVGLGGIRSQPEFLEKYSDLADEYGV